MIPPAPFWAAAAAHAAPGDQAALGNAAAGRGLYRAAAQLHKNAAACGDLRAAFWLAQPPPCLRADPRPAHWAAAHVSLDDPGGVARLLGVLREAGAGEQVAVLAERAAVQGPLDNPYGVATLLGMLRQAGADEQAAAVVARNPAAHVSLDSPRGVAMLVDRPRGVGAGEQAAALAERAAAHVPLDDPGGVAWLLGSLKEVGAGERAAAIVGRLPAAGMFGLFLEQHDHADQFQFGREPGGSPATPWDWADLDIQPAS